MNTPHEMRWSAVRPAVQLAGGLILSLGVACQPTGDAALSEAEMRAALPEASQVVMDLPGAEAKLVADVDDPSGMRETSANLARGANQTVYNVLSMIDAVTDHPSTVVDASTRRWGPWTNEAGITQVFTMTLQDDGDLGYRLDAKPAGAGDEAFVAIVTGLIYGGYDVYKNVGAFSVDYDAAATVDPTHDRGGFARFEYNTASADRVVKADLDGVFEVAGEPIDTQLAFKAFAAGGGELGFRFYSDFVAGADGALEDSALHTRWLEDGSGRSDATITGGTLGAHVLTASECYAGDGLLDFQATWMDGQGQQAAGDAAACVFETPEFPAL